MPPVAKMMGTLFGRTMPPGPETAQRNKLWLWGMVIGTVVVLGIWILVWGLVDPTTGVTRGDVVLRGPRGMHDQRDCGKVELAYPAGSHVTFEFDLCKIIHCGTGSWAGYAVYLCVSRGGGRPCPTWSDIFAYAGTGEMTRPCKDAGMCSSAALQISITRKPNVRGGEGGNNPLLLSINGITTQMGGAPPGCSMTTGGGSYLYLSWGVRDVWGTVL